MSAYDYVNWKGAAVNILKRYEDMNLTRALAADRYEMISQRQYDPPAPAMDAPSKRRSYAGEREAGLCEAIDMKQAAFDAIKRCDEYFAFFSPAWNCMEDDERDVLSEFFMSGCKTKQRAIDGLSERLGYERTKIYELRDRALTRFTLLLYGE